MTGPEHYFKAEELLSQDGSAAQHKELVARAQAHATLALAAATAVAHVDGMIVADHDAWCDVASERPATPDRAS